MSHLQTCPHMLTATDIPFEEIEKNYEKIHCADCDCTGPNLWICLHQDCHRIGCSEQFNDHNTLHNASFPNHCVHMNLTTQRIWCYECKREVFMRLQQSYCDSDADGGDDAKRLYHPATVTDGMVEYNNSGLFDRHVGMGGDTSESSDAEDSSIVSTSRPQGLVGLQNIGNTCYLNAALQALSNTVPLTKFFLDCGPTVQIVSDGRKPGLSRTYQTLVKDMWMKKNGGYINPQGILFGIRNVYPMFRGYQQHDTQEFLRNFMDQLHEELKQIAVGDSSASDVDSFSLSADDNIPASNNYDSIESSEGEYETCDSGVSERSSLSDDTERPNNNGSAIPKTRLTRSLSPSRRIRTKLGSNNVIENQPTSSQSNSTAKKQTKFKSIISDVFDGKLLSTVQCLTCNRVSSRVETFQDLSLPIPSRDHLAVIHGRNVAPGSTCSEAVLPVDNGWVSWFLTWLKSWFYGPTITLHDCLAAFFSTDELKGDNMYSCERCNKLRNGIKYSKVLQLPEVLCIHLKRFRHELMFSSKISSTVSFPLRGLDMKPYLHADCISQVTTYELFSVICHHGTAGGGHYMSYALNSGQWYEFDDQYVTRVSSETVLACEAYVLFYRKVSPDARTTVDKVRDLFGSCFDDEYVYISKQWLSRFNTCAEPGPIDNRDFLCQHGSICPEQVGSIEQLAARVPRKVYTFLFMKFGGHPAAPNAQCPSCQATSAKLDHEFDTFIRLNAQSREQRLPTAYLLSKPWFQTWLAYVQRKTFDHPGPISNNKDPLDFHQEYAEVTEEIWDFLYGIYGGGPEIRLTLEEEEPPSEDMETSEPAALESETPAPEFVIPKLKKESTTGCVDTEMYSKGEPMETEVDSTEKIVTECQQDETEKKLVNGSLSNTSFTDDEAVVSEHVGSKTKRYYRRRKRDNF